MFRIRISAISLLAASLLAVLSGCREARSITPSPTAPAQDLTATPIPSLTFQPPATTTPRLTATTSPADLQRQRLYQASLAYLAGSDAESWQVAKNLGYAPLGGYPSNMCGPLAIAILQDAGLVSQSVDLHDFWLLNPAVDQQLLEYTFPRDHFQWLHSDLPINQVDFSQFPLKAGDLVYIYSGYQGDYSHVLVVTRVDDAGRAYSVTNNFTADGFLIQEYLLYDPADDSAGIFNNWTDTANRSLGLTGFGGMDVWRPLHLPYYADGSP